ncbi:hypothetical protein MSKU15_2520 [Komagataeibacter diospyri]|uniref:hypothetical protein n=1 Tax=Komagataeibacter diospyri TaxID=1932662 RepID=UPI00113F2642|nr:hypothetical protein [Komagataeibacter diospyri]GCE90919.1 hypothetical protein MSKU15_2520 [Komagataeibacter diospyri]
MSNPGCVELKKHLDHIADLEKFVNEMMHQGIVNGWDTVLEKFAQARGEIEQKMRDLGC